MRWVRESIETIVTLILVCVLGAVVAFIFMLVAMGINKTLVTLGMEPFITEFYSMPGGVKVVVPTPVSYKPK